jgi:hypothetical protein
MIQRPAHPVHDFLPMGPAEKVSRVFPDYSLFGALGQVCESM